MSHIARIAKTQKRCRSRFAGAVDANEEVQNSAARRVDLIVFGDARPVSNCSKILSKHHLPIKSGSVPS